MLHLRRARRHPGHPRRPAGQSFQGEAEAGRTLILSAAASSAACLGVQRLSGAWLYRVNVLSLLLAETKQRPPTQWGC